MSKAHNELYRQIWDEISAGAGGVVNLESVDEEFYRRVVLDIDAAKRSVCQVARRSVDTERTKFRAGQMSLPTMPDPDEHLVTAENRRVQKLLATQDDVLASLELSDHNLNIQFVANQARHAEYRRVARYLADGMLWGQSVIAWQTDHPSTDGKTGN